MTLYKLQYIKDLIEEAGPELARIYVYRNTNSGAWMFAAFMHSSVDDMATSPYVIDPILIWSNGNWNGNGNSMRISGWFKTKGLE